MELNIVNSTAPSYTEQVGISQARVHQLAGQMDDLLKIWRNQPVRVSDAFNEIAHLCNNLEEMVYCTVAHTCLLAKQGIYLVQ